MNDKLSHELNEELTELKGLMTGLIFDKLEEVNSLRNVSSKYSQDYKKTPDYNKINQIIEQYITKYTKDLGSLNQVTKSLAGFKEQLTRNIITLYERVENAEELGEWKDEVIVLDYLVTLRQLVGLLQGNDIEGFHTKSKI